MKNINLLSEFKTHSFEQWKKEAEASLKTEPYSKLLSKTYENIDLQPIYTLNDTKDATESFPCFFDYRRGKKLENKWIYSQEVYAKNFLELNKKIKSFIESGVNEININLDKILIKNKNDFEIIFKNIDLEAITVSFISTKNPSLIYKNFIEFSKNKNNLKDSIPIDPLSIYNSDVDSDIEILKKDMFDNFKLNKNLKTIGINLSLYQEAGASAIQELSISLASTVYYLKYFLSKNENLEDVFNSIKYTFSVGSNFFMELAKFRAFRVLWAMLLKAYELDSNNISCFIHARTSLFNKTLLDVENNILRTTAEAFSAVMGGVDSLTILPFDYLEGETTELSERLAKNTHYILAEECMFKDVIDPVGGSYYIETLTDKLVSAAWQSFCNIEESGGIFENIKSGNIKKDINAVYEKRLNNFKKRKDLLVGTNIYPNSKDVLKLKLEPDKLEILKARRLSKTYEFLNTFNKEKYPILQVNYMKSSLYKTRAEWTSSFFEAGGFKVANKIDFYDDETIINLLKEKKYKFLILCSSDAGYSNFVTRLAKKIKEFDSSTYIMLAGLAGENEKAWIDAGVNEFVNIKSNNYEVLLNLLKIAGDLK